MPAGGQAAHAAVAPPDTAASVAQITATMQAAASVLTHDSPTVSQPVPQKRFSPILPGADTAAQQARDRRQAMMAAIQRYLDILRGMHPPF